MFDKLKDMDTGYAEWMKTHKRSALVVGGLFVVLSILVEAVKLSRPSR